MIVECVPLHVSSFQTFSSCLVGQHDSIGLYYICSGLISLLFLMISEISCQLSVDCLANDLAVLTAV